MTEQGGRSLRASSEGIQKANTALLNFAVKADLAAQLEMSRTTVTNFFAGRLMENQGANLEQATHTISLSCDYKLLMGSAHPTCSFCSQF